MCKIKILLLQDQDSPFVRSSFSIDFYKLLATLGAPVGALLFPKNAFLEFWEHAIPEYDHMLSVFIDLGIGYWVSGTRYQVLGIGYQVLGIWYWVSGIGYRWNQAIGAGGTLGLGLGEPGPTRDSHSPVRY